MIRSMTGFGASEVEAEGGIVRVQIRSVNHRFLNTSIRTPHGFDGHDAAIQSWLRPFVTRGHLTVSITFEREDHGASGDLPRVDPERAAHYAAELRELRDAQGIEGPIEMRDLLRFSDLFQSPEKLATPELDPEVVKGAVERASVELVGFREAEGRRLQEDLEGRLEAISVQLDRVEGRAPERLVSERDRLRAAIAELAAQEEVDEDRLAREVAWLAEKWDINEEIVRFRAHVALFGETLDGDASESVGKRLSFVVQEMNREANTIGSKANDAEIAHASVALKEEVERLREQVENVE